MSRLRGGGSTALACQQLGRKCIACEIDEDYFNITKKRIENDSRLIDYSRNTRADNFKKFDLLGD